MVATSRKLEPKWHHNRLNIDENSACCDFVCCFSWYSRLCFVFSVSSKRTATRLDRCKKWWKSSKIHENRPESTRSL